MANIITIRQRTIRKQSHNGTRTSRGVVAYLRKAADPKLEQFGLLSDHQIVQLMFSHGLRLTEFGVEIMQRHFQSCRIAIAEQELERPAHLMFLDTMAKLPYFVGDDFLITYDHIMALRLRLVEGYLSILVQIG